MDLLRTPILVQIHELLMNRSTVEEALSRVTHRPCSWSLKFLGHSFRVSSSIDKARRIAGSSFATKEFWIYVLDVDDWGTLNSSTLIPLALKEVQAKSVLAV